MPEIFTSSITGQRQFGVGRGAGIVPIAELEQRAILRAIQELNGDKLTAAKLLGIGKTTLYRKLRNMAQLRAH
jgi:transcriptional regulator of acetoin/glycerol metabolism